MLFSVNKNTIIKRDATRELNKYLTYETLSLCLHGEQLPSASIFTHFQFLHLEHVQLPVYQYEQLKS